MSGQAPSITNQNRTQPDIRSVLNIDYGNTKLAGKMIFVPKDKDYIKLKIA